MSQLLSPLNPLKFCALVQWSSGPRPTGPIESGEKKEIRNLEIQKIQK